MWNILIRLILCFVSLSVSSASLWPNLQNVQTSSGDISQKTNLVIELAIFCDIEFASRFQHDKELIKEYWEAVMYDVHLKFQTLPSFNISFRVTTLYSLKAAEEDQLLGNDDQYSIRDISDRFDNWSYFQLKRIPKFDISILVLGTNLPDFDGIADYGLRDSICQGLDAQQQKWLTNIILTMAAPLTQSLAQNIAYILGAPSDDEPKYYSTCNPNTNPGKDCCILGNIRPYPDIEPHFFSRCTDQLLVKHLPMLVSEETFCMDGDSAERNPVIDTEKLFKDPSKVYAYGIEEQCQILTNDIEAIVKSPSCRKSRCRSAVTSQDFTFVPLDGSACGKNGIGRCLRGTCVEPKVHLVNVATGKCLVSEASQFATDDKPVLRECTTVPMDLLQDAKQDNTNMRKITMMYSTVNGSAYKHLSLSEKGVATFVPKRADSRANWIIKRLRDVHWQEFVLVHSATGHCAKAEEDEVNVNFTEDCSGTDRASRWKFENRNDRNKWNLDGMFSAEYAETYLLEEKIGCVIAMVGVILLLLSVYLVLCWKCSKPTVQIDEKLKTNERKVSQIQAKGKHGTTKKVKFQ